MPRYTVVIPTHNRASKVEEAVRSVLDGGFDDVEVVVVDDGSTDDTAGVLASLGADDRVRWITTPNMGACVARNIGIAMATGDWIAFLDSDDRFEPGYLQAVEAVRSLASPRVVGLYTGGRLIDEETGACMGTLGDRPLPDPARSILTETTIVALVARRSALLEIGGWDPRFRARQDADLYFRITLVGDLDFVPGAYYEVLLGGDDRISANPKARIQGMRAFYDKHREHMTLRQRSEMAKRIVRRAIDGGEFGVALLFAPLGSAYLLRALVSRVRRRSAVA